MDTITNLLSELLIAVVGFNPFAPGLSACHDIKDMDRQNYCLALAQDKPETCTAIKDADQKNFCLAVVTERNTSCPAIQASDLKQKCQALFP